VANFEAAPKKSMLAPSCAGAARAAEPATEPKALNDSRPGIQNQMLHARLNFISDIAVSIIAIW
jgi:hypothetical protein